MAERDVNIIGGDEDNGLIKAFERGLSLLEASVWQDDSMNNAYEKGLDIVDGKEKSLPSKEGRRRKWRVGDYCRAIYSDHNEYYEAKIVYIDGDFCTVEFLGYGNEEDSELKDLIETRGRDAREMQINEANEDESEDTADESDSSDSSYQQRNGNQPATVPSAAAYRAPPTLPDNLPFIPKPQRAWHPTPPMMPQYSTKDSAPPMMPNSAITDPSISSLLTAWYMAGYYTGKFYAGEENPGCRCDDNHSG